jgi:hypothetical protein
MAIVLRSVKGSNLVASEVDGNFTDLDGRVTALEDAPTDAIVPSNMVVIGTQWWIYYEDGSTYGPFTLPQATFRPSVVSAIDVPTDGIYRPDLGDANGYLRHTGSTTLTVLMPLDADVAYAVDTEISFRTAGAGAIVFETATSGPVLNPPEGCLKQVSAQGITVTLKKVDEDEWDLIGLFDEDVTA